ncbi:MFS transporter [Actinoplanes sp. NPDC049316]|uniref:MFS transporter n=1 Tax=Actinoplanes sp. NPDC049316 TaxID=3154727 RepID=UPI0034488939
MSAILRRPYALTTTGAWSLVFLAAFESLAVTTIMPDVTAGLHGRGLYALAFSAALAAGVVGMVTFGAWADRRGPAVPLLSAILTFGAGLALAGTATSMPLFVAGRFLQGLGGGGQTVALYVLIALVYPAELHIKIFGAFATAWVLPSLIGPSLAGFTAAALSWHWVFLGVLILVAVATTLMLPALRGLDRSPTDRVPDPAADARRAAEATVVALGVIVLSSLAEIDAAWLLAPATVVVAAVALRNLVPAGTYRIARGLPAAVALCAVAGGVFAGTEVYLPLLLHDRYGVPTWLSGITLTAGAVAWALASAVQARLGDRITPASAIRAGTILLAAGAATELMTAALHLHPAAAAGGWFLAGGGMGTLYPRISALVLATSRPGEEGFNTAAKSITDAVGGSASLAAAGALFTVLPFVAPFAFTTALGVMAILVGRRAVVPSAIETLSLRPPGRDAAPR